MLYYTIYSAYAFSLTTTFESMCRLYVSNGCRCSRIDMLIKQPQFSRVKRSDVSSQRECALS